jgi:hypothetical protein
MLMMLPPSLPKCFNASRHLTSQKTGHQNVL